MSVILIAVLGRLEADPAFAVRVVARVLGRADLVPALLRVCQRESACRPTGVHRGDAHLSLLGWNAQVGLGHIDPRCQPHREGQWATRGPLGMSAVSAWIDLWKCYRPEVLDSAVVSAYLGVRRWERVCENPRRRDGWCK